MNINKTITLTFEGKDYPITITMRHTDYVEANGVNTLLMMTDCQLGTLKISQANKLFALLLKMAGAAPDDSLDDLREKVWAEMCAKGEVSVAETIIMTSEILKIFFLRSKKKSTKTNKKKRKK